MLVIQSSKARSNIWRYSAVAGLVQHYRSKSRGKSRSKSKVRTGKYQS